MLHDLGHRQADVLGISWGGGLAQQFALGPAAPVLRRLILVATQPSQTMVPPNPLPPVENVPAAAGATCGEAAPEPTRTRWPAPCARRGSARSASVTCTSTPPRWGSPPCRCCRAIRQRTLVLTGDDDPIIPVANGRILAGGHPARDPARLPRRPRRAGHPPQPAHTPDHQLPGRAAARRPARCARPDQPSSPRPGPAPGHRRDRRARRGAARRPRRPAGRRDRRPGRRRAPRHPRASSRHPGGLVRYARVRA